MAARRRRMSPRPFELEVLEDRTVPATFTVTNLTDLGDGSLRDAVSDANAAAGVDVIRFADNLSGTITLQFGEIELTDDVAIEGPGAEVITISGGNASRIFWARQFTNRRYDYAISGLTLANGADSDGGFGGGAILATSQQTLRLSDLIIENCFSAASGGAVEAVGSDLDLFVARSIFRNNVSG